MQVGGGVEDVEEVEGHAEVAAAAASAAPAFAPPAYAAAAGADPHAGVETRPGVWAPAWEWAAPAEAPAEAVGEALGQAACVGWWAEFGSQGVKGAQTLKTAAV